MSFLANLNKNHMMSFLMLTIGSLILGTEDRSGLSNHYYITDRAFTIKQGGIINVEYGVKQNDSYLSEGLELLTVEFDDASTDAINYGYIPLASNLTLRSISAWIYLDADAAIGTPKTIIGHLTAANGNWTNVNNGRKIQFYQIHSGGADCIYNTPANSVPLSAWTHVVVTRDITTPTAAPLIYINGVSQALTVVQVAIGAARPETGVELVIGNAHSTAFNYNRPFDGKIFDPRVFNRILSAAEVTTLYNGGTPLSTLVTSGLVFQGMASYTDLAYAAGNVLLPANKITENILRAVGTPNGTPTIRANP